MLPNQLILKLEERYFQYLPGCSSKCILKKNNYGILKIPDDSADLFEFDPDEQSDNGSYKSLPLHNLQSPKDRAYI